MNWGDIPDLSPAIAASIMEALKQNDPGTYSHCCRVSRYCRNLGYSMGLNEFEVKIAEYAGLFHDVGKIGIPNEIINKPDRLTEEEDKIMQGHAMKSFLIVQKFSDIPFFRSMLPGIRHHHERIDGLGYPGGIVGDNIPLMARLILVVDTFDAMTSSRPYRKGLPKEVAFKELKLFAGKQFDQQIVNIFLESYPHWNDLESQIGDDYVAKTFKRAA